MNTKASKIGAVLSAAIVIVTMLWVGLTSDRPSIPAVYAKFMPALTRQNPGTKLLADLTH